MTNLLRSNDTRTVRSDKPGLVLSEELMLDTDHVLLWDTLRDAHDEAYLCVYCLHHGLGGAGRWHVYHARVSA